jgi:hypothetical protein
MDLVQCVVNTMSIAPGDRPSNSRPPESDHDVLLGEIRALRQELRATRRLFDEFAKVYLNARFPYGKPTDRWRPRG